MSDQRVERVADEADLDAAIDVRHEVFVEGQGVPPERELDGRDDEATHFLARDGDEVVGTARLREYHDGAGEEPRTAKVERVAVRESRRGEGWGARIMQAVEEHARKAGYERVYLHAQVPVVAFYERLGYEAHGEEFEDAGIPHREMTKSL
ncbi:GNAT family N-acetyltransferase [Haloglomus litoreum]|uniref:GNAT family N-acetyltransferase n=1 Tax=Haloglomus litoreum TaxID=3034026 RepID=UPI0023E8879E|nr:GNAT family N-acetyltransferase [Haloglomus sp. DT116]